MKTLKFDTYAGYGLQQNPFLVHALRADERGRRLLVGRDAQIELVARKLHKKGKITCLDGHVGVGKTSLVNVATYECFEAFKTGQTTQLLVPMEEPFQLSKNIDAQGFCSHVFRRVAQTLLGYRSQLEHFSGPSEIAKRLDPWLNSPIVQHVTEVLGVQNTIGVPGIASAAIKTDHSTSAQINTSAGFADEGLEQLVRRWLNQIFTTEGNGGVVCVIDNLELLEGGAAVRQMMENLRDRLFTVNGLRWVFCGANGVIHSLAASPRLASYLNTPVIEVEHIAPAAIAPLFQARLNEFAMDAASVEANLPIQIIDLQALYLIINFNLRDLLACADEYCDHLFNLHPGVLGEPQKKKRFAKWLEQATAVRYRALSSRLPPVGWSVLDIAMSDDYRGSFGVGDYGSFNSNSKVAISQSTFKKHLGDLVKLGLLSRAVEDDMQSDDGFRRDVYNVTAKGALIHYARLVKHETLAIKPTTWLKRIDV